MPHACLLFGFGSGSALSMTTADKMFICMPLFHAMGLLLQMTSCLFYGSSAHVVRRFSATTWLEGIRSSDYTGVRSRRDSEFIFRQPPTPHDQDHKLCLMLTVP